MNKMLKVVYITVIFSFFITIIDTILVSYELLAKGWCFLDYLQYFGKSVLIDILFIFILTSLFSLVSFFAGRLIKKDIFRKDILEKGLAFSSATLFIALMIPSINFYFLHSVFAIKSIIANAMLLFSILPLTIVLYYKTYDRIDISGRISRIVSFVIISITFFIIISSFISGLFSIDNVEIEGGGVDWEFTPDIVIITIDALRADHLSCYGYDEMVTKNIDEFADDGILFTNAYPTTSWTLPSMMSMLTGKYPTVHRCIDYSHKVSDEIIMISQVLRSYGYETQGIVSNPGLSHRFGFSRGFDSYLEYGDFKYLDTFNDTRLYILFMRFSSFFLGNLGVLSDQTEWVTEKFAKFLKSDHYKPFFLWVHYLDPHDPYAPPKEYIPDIYEPSEKSWEYLQNNDVRFGGKYREKDKLSIMNLYDGEILYVDEKIGEIFTIMKNEDLYDDTMIIISSDHGEAFWEHGYLGHGKTLYNQVLHIPFILKLPEGYHYDSSIKTVESYISLKYIPRTILYLLGISEYDYFGEDSILDIMEGSEEDVIFSETLRSRPYFKKMKSGEYSLIYNKKIGSIELYDVLQDPDELEEISEQNPIIVEEMFSILLEWMDEVEKEKECYGEEEVIGIDSSTIEEIRGLGYVD